MFVQDILIPMGIIGAIGAILGVILGIADKVFEVKVDPRIEGVHALLPHYNCGACGYPGCLAMAEGMINKEFNNVSLCKPSNQNQRQAIIDYMNNTPGLDGEITVIVP